MRPQSTGSTVDDHNIDLLGEVVLHSFTGSPTTIGPFEQALLHWSVSAPAGVTILLANLPVSHSGERTVIPTGAVESYALSAKAGNARRPLGVVTIYVNYAACWGPESPLLDELLAGQITEKINADTSGIRFRRIPVTTNGTTTWVRSTPRVVITSGTLSVDLQLEQRLDYLPDPAVDIHVDFGIQVVPDPMLPVGHRRIVSVNQHIDVDVSAGPITWWLAIGLLIPDVLQQKIDEAEAKARARAQQMIVDIVGPIDPRLGHSRNLNNFFLKPPGMETHDARFYVDAGGLGTFAVTFCPWSNTETLAAVLPGAGSAAGVLQ